MDVVCDAVDPDCSDTIAEGAGGKTVSHGTCDLDGICINGNGAEMVTIPVENRWVDMVHYQ